MRNWLCQTILVTLAMRNAASLPDWDPDALKISLEADFSLSDGGEDLSIDATMLASNSFHDCLDGSRSRFGCL
ncbi:hypothetical protein HGRIS_001476 [Hohenbuehelia grisea]|uniref:Uncharacterized protein n=1 Tax=Hohenbuehelia grisea TaxID=104357 RepID=A0ABR3JQ75_9AGAR